jgi:MFS family permease
LWTANAVSNLGDGITLVAGPLLAATLTRDPRLVAGLAVAQRLPWLLFSLVSGALVDRLDRRLLMVRVDAARCLAVGLLGVAVLADVATLPLLYAVFFALGTAETLFDNAAVSILPAGTPGPSRPRPPWSRPWAAGSGSSGPPAPPRPPSAARSPKGCAGWPGTSCCASWPWPSR